MRILDGQVEAWVLAIWLDNHFCAVVVIGDSSPQPLPMPEWWMELDLSQIAPVK
jgi:hypothetical protein